MVDRYYDYETQSWVETKEQQMPDKVSPEMQKAIDDARADMAARQKRTEEIAARHKAGSGMFNNDSPRAQYIIASSTSKQAGGYAVLTMGDVYKIVHDRLEYARCTIGDVTNPDRTRVPLTNLLDIDALCQNVCCEIEKKLGIYPNIPPAEEREYEA